MQHPGDAEHPGHQRAGERRCVVQDEVRLELPAGLHRVVDHVDCADLAEQPRHEVVVDPVDRQAVSRSPSRACRELLHPHFETASAATELDPGGRNARLGLDP
ncbi:MAG TPA: hypothetical protein VFJ19_18965 [Nocardioidaceae bacterium]|nr:hypothetical protein [Nocardioidaceae bacterium]